MKNFFYIISILISIMVSCTALKSTRTGINKPLATKSDTIRIINDSLEYEVIIIDPGFNTWLVSRAYPRNYHTQSYLQNKNQMYINEWNNRFMQPQRYNPDLYGMSINYDYTIDYGYEVNYLIYNYMIFFQNTYNQKLYGYVPPR